MTAVDLVSPLYSIRRTVPLVTAKFWDGWSVSLAYTTKYETEIYLDFVLAEDNRINYFLKHSPEFFRAVFHPAHP